MMLRRLVHIANSNKNVVTCNSNNNKSSLYNHFKSSNINETITTTTQQYANVNVRYYSHNKAINNNLNMYERYRVVKRDIDSVRKQRNETSTKMKDKKLTREERDQLVEQVGFSHCFRSEVGGGTNNRGIYRVHQFSKVEMFVLANEQDSDRIHRELLDTQIEMFNELELPFRVLDMPTGDLGAPAYRKFDIEVWIPSRNGYGEISSTSNCTDYQSRRLNIKHHLHADADSHFVHTLNGTAIAIPRIILAILENNQQKDGSMIITIKLFWRIYSQSHNKQGYQKEDGCFPSFSCRGQWIYEVEYANAGCTGAINRVNAFYAGQCYAGGSDYWWYTVSGGTASFAISQGGCFAAPDYAYNYPADSGCTGSMQVITRTVPPLPATGFLGFERIRSPNPSSDCLNYENERSIDRINACVMLPSNRGAGIYIRAYQTTQIGFGYYYAGCGTVMGTNVFTSPSTCSSVDGGYTWGQVFPALGISSVGATNTLNDVSLTTFSSNIGGSIFYYTATLSCPAGQYPMATSINPATPTATLAIPSAARGQSCTIVVSANGDTIVSGGPITGQSGAFTLPLLATMSTLTPGTVTTKTIAFTYSSSTGGTYTVTVGGTQYPTCSGVTTCTATGLNPNTQYTVSVTVTNAGTTSAPLSFTTTTANIIDTPSVSINAQTSTSLTVSYAVTGGYGATIYQLRLNNVVQASCITSSCTIPGLVYGTVYTFSASATNDGYTATSPNFVKNFWTLPTMGPVNIVNYGTTWLTFSYSSNDGRVIGANTFAIRVNGILSTNSTCSGSTNCYVGGLTAGSTPAISITSSNSGETSATQGTANQKLYDSVSTLVVTPSLQTSSSFRVTYSSSNGIPLKTIYQVLVDSISAPSCPATEGACTIISLPPKTYNVTVTATNDGLLISKSINVLVTNFPTMNPIVVGDIGTTWVEFTYSSIGGTAGGNSFTINVAGSDIATASCKQGPFCRVSGLTSGSSPVISIFVTNNGEVSNTVSSTPSLYQPTSPPIISFSRVSPTTLNISWTENDGVPGLSLFDVLLNGTNICPNIAINNCLYNSITDGLYYNFTIIVKNDNFVSSNSKSYFSYPPTTPVLVTAIGKTGSIYVNWTESSGGVPDETKYHVFLSIDNDHWARVCLGGAASNSLNLSCLVDDLTDNTFYYVMVTVENTDFEVLRTISNATTLPFNGTNSCRPAGSEVDCSGNGTCPNHECLCADGWDGQYCEVPTDGGGDGGDGGGGVIITPNPSNPGIDIDKGGVKYSFTINKLLERDLDMNVAKVLELTSIKWQPVQQVNDTLVHPTNNGSVIRRSWTYTAINVTSYAAVINITFIQLEAIPNVTVGDSYPMSFAGDEFLLKIGSFKYAMEISQWNWDSQLSTLELWTSINAQPEECASDDSNPIAMVNGTTSNFINIGQANGKLLYGRLVKRVVLDSIPRSVNHYLVQESETNTTVVTAIPYFENQVDIDPNFSLLLDTSKSSNDGCSKPDNTWRIIVGVVVGVAALAAITFAGTLFYKRKLRNHQQQKTLAKKLSSINNNNQS
ncbi:hypothetical protein DFA_00666 [Cavenderia fasciculata]|uniref:serine--tRNA ligase n=1 Tax=Cavenderia fasciculata TaxID=261658 RepID=F4PT65_CACFS|nr:uncharacterized protein DFA_00666 [Cavenderia fasciculata]EGG20801.1 hypothetical protein DFA_00666 [Cavenderia fasciculata]|eukprot:XP_004358651.1 hypothetical protein DFA_00666 [Cavenderia fasciculata]